MKNKLLFLVIIILTAIKGFSQVEANPAPDMSQCGSEVFDLTVQTPTILGDQDPENYIVTYYLTQQDAANDTNPIVNPTVFVAPQQQLIFAKVTNLLTEETDITVFNVSWVSGVFVPELQDVVACDFYVLAALDMGNYYLSPGGVDLLPVGTAITITTLVYIYAENESGCTDESSFLVVISPGPLTNQPTPLHACDTDGNGIETFNLNDILPQLVDDENTSNITYHQTMMEAEAGMNAIANHESFVSSDAVLFVRGQNSGNDCFWIVSIQLNVMECNDNTVSGFVKLNTDDNCDTFEAAGVGIPVYYMHNNDIFIAYTNVDGHYSFENLPDGEGSVYIPGSLGATVSPENHTVTMPGNEENLNFCITPGASVNDVSISLLTVTQARPGFGATYVLVYQNLGTTTQSGDITFTFDDTKMTFIDADPAMVQSGNTLTLSYTDLLPYHTRVAVVNFTVLPEVTIGTVLNFTASITPLDGDVNTGNNSSVMSQVVVGSYDPNDISVREGATIFESQTDDYLNYTVRFQNSGNANAEFVRVVVVLDDNLDWSTFEAMAASDEFTVTRSGNEVTFMFNDIDLPYESIDEPGSHGYVLYRIKPKATVTIGDSMSAQADIFFDFNPVIETESITTTVITLTGINDNDISSFAIYPNPASANVNLILKNTNAAQFDVTVTDVLGKTVIRSEFSGTEANLDINTLTSGVYFINITAEGKQATKKLVVK